MSRKKETITLSISPGTKEKLEAIARRFNIFWGKSPSPSGLIAAIAQQELEVGEPFVLTQLQLQALIKAIKALINSGEIKDAQLLTELLFERGSLEPFLRQSLLRQISQPTEIWRKILEEQIQKQQPFLLLYLNSQGLEETFTVRWADLQFFEKEFYLVAWCEETSGSEEVLALVHNRCFRLDRIINILPVNKIWRKNLDFILVKLHFWGDSAKRYQKRTEDVEIWTFDGICKVTRKVFNTFWLMQEVLANGENCVIVSPDSVRDRIKMKVQMMAQQYDLAIYKE
ncbi:MAG: WYL domain-containing protein [Hydrococcus sp. C42_A2020_068]|uniref:helix-turn-helix transcriptional regulator n=1 Tax=Pleurocapsa sp. PCC 7327 TaxID=118163 RepID=UPI00029FD3B6|nr:WYL domain-containing protein [Pleurocapsa sp. PCC 7327]AFY78161.1 putative transcriptional regulator [Pleurocapsa sp. PCC 7327]MBF2021694.1 WYL domain-containing protein [Hydrococcus sp. C42_A2020_068]